MWMALTKKRVFNPVKFLTGGSSSVLGGQHFMLPGIYCWRQILFGRRYTLWAPHPTIATQWSPAWNTPGIDWQKEFQNSSAEARPSSERLTLLVQRLLHLQFGDKTSATAAYRPCPCRAVCKSTRPTRHPARCRGWPARATASAHRRSRTNPRNVCQSGPTNVTQ